jgi:hypothetical protein
MAMSSRPSVNRVMGLVFGFQSTQIVYVAAKLGIADILASGPKSVDELASLTHTHAPSLYRLLRALSAHGIFTERAGREFEMSEMATCLQEHGPSSIKNVILCRGADYYHTWGELLFSIETGGPSFDRVFGMSNWSYRQHNHDANRRFNLAVAEVARQRAASLADRVSLSDKDVVVDVGGGNGTLLAALLCRHAHARGILFDLPQVMSDATEQLARSGVLERCLTISGDFFRDVPLGGTLYILSAVLHDWNDDRASAILRQCRMAMNGAPLLVVERVLPGPNESSPLFLSDLDMLVNTGGGERTESEWAALLTSSGFRLESISPGIPPFSILRALPR